MVCRALVQLEAGVCRRWRTNSTRARWAAAVAVLMLAALAMHADLLLSVASSTVAANKAVVSYVEESTKLIRMLVEEKHDAGDLAGVLLSNNSAEGMDSRAHDFVQPPPKVEDLTDNATAEQELPTSEKAAPPPAGWRSFSFPSDHVLVFGCSGDEFTVRIMPRLEAFEQQKLCHANGNLPNDGCLPAAGTLSKYNRHPYYYALFWSLPGMEKWVPVPLNHKELEVALVMEEAPEAFVLSADVVAFYGPNPGTSEIHIRPKNAVGFMPVSTMEEEGQALRALYPHTIVHSGWQ